MRLSGFLMQDETFRFPHSEWDFSVFLFRMRLSGFLMQNETFQFSYATWDFLSEAWKKNHFTKTASLRARGQKMCVCKESLPFALSWPLNYESAQIKLFSRLLVCVYVYPNFISIYLWINYRDRARVAPSLAGPANYYSAVEQQR
jgi:hypothetical protein